ncbi:MAG: hypothetical protein RLY66_476 [Candidatus Parcubacteria bacterium]|jgi:DNA-binding CsgD family transcriptional regulator
MENPPTEDKLRGRPLTKREREVLVWLAEGLVNKEVASTLNIGHRTVDTHREKIMRKLDIHGIAGLTRYAVKCGLVQLPAPIKLTIIGKDGKPITANPPQTNTADT